MTWHEFTTAVTAAGVQPTDVLDFIDVMDEHALTLDIYRDADNGTFCVMNE